MDTQAKGHFFYADGLRFSCTRCSSCCRHESGFVFLSQKDLALLASECRIGYTEFIEVYCRWVPGFGDGAEGDRLSLREKSNFDCIFWDGVCTVYRARPLQCRTFPFWRSILSSEAAWDSAADACPGMNTGALHSREEIERCLAARSREPLVLRGSFSGGKGS